VLTYVYANRNGNGNKQAVMDFIGGGIFQNTFRNNYLKLSKRKD
jgi:hypothetical protein